MKKINFKESKKYIIWFLIWVSFLWGYSYASTSSNGTIGGLFTKLWNDWKLVGSNIQDWTVWVNQLANSSVNNSKIANAAVNQSKVLNWYIDLSTNQNISWTKTFLNNVRSTAFFYTSDERLKDNIEVIESPLEKISSLNWVSWNWKEDWKKDYGFIAQDVELVFPELVDTDENGFKSVQYWNIIWILVEALKEQQNQINSLQDKINNL